MSSATQHNDPPKEDVIAIMGMTGSGKSTFLKLITSDERFKVGHDLKSETVNIQDVQFTYTDAKGCQVDLCFLDTPGFGDTHKPNSETLKVISDGLTDRPNITGIVYFHNINEVRLTHLAHDAKEIFYDICGGEAMKNVILCTTQWDKLMDKTEGDRRESQLRGEYWKKMIDDGAQTARHDNTRASAGVILERIIGFNPVTPKLVTELRETPNMPIGDTSAGRVASKINDEKTKEIERSMAELRKSLDDARVRAEKLEARRVEEERKREKREAEIMTQLKEAAAAAAAARNETDRLQAERKQKEAEEKLEKERKEREDQRKKKEADDARQKAKALRVEEEEKRLQDERKKTEKEKAALEEPFDVVEYSKGVGRKMLGKTVGGLVGGTLGYVGKLGFGCADACAEMTGGKKLSDRKQKLMERAGGAAVKGNDAASTPGMLTGLGVGFGRNVASGLADILVRSGKKGPK